MSVVERRPRAAAVTLAAAVAAVALALAGGAVPHELVPRAPIGLLLSLSDLVAAISAVGIVWLALGYESIKRDNVPEHRGAMLVAVCLLVSGLFLAAYRRATVGAPGYAGDSAVATFGYELLVAAAGVCGLAALPFAFYAAALGATREVAAIRNSPHPQIGRIGAALSATAFLAYVAAHLLRMA